MIALTLRRTLLPLALLALAAGPVHAWRTDLPSSTGFSHFESLALDPQGNPVGAGTLHGMLAVVKLNRVSGAVIWSSVIGPSSATWFSVLTDPQNAEVKVGASGTVFVVGNSDGDRIAAALDGSSGGLLWFRDLGPIVLPAVATGLVLDPAGEVIVGGPTVVKLSPATGATLWEVDVFGPQKGSWALAVDPAGDVVAAAADPNALYVEAKLELVKLSGISGAELWQRPVPAFSDHGQQVYIGDPTPAIAIDSAGNVFVGGGTAGDLTSEISRLDGATGTPDWVTTIGFVTSALAVTSSGDVVGVGPAMHVQYGLWAAAVKLSGATGAALWAAQPFGEPIPAPNSSLFAVTVDASDDVYVAGAIWLDPFYFSAPHPNQARFIKLDGGLGTVIWDYDIWGSSTSQASCYPFAQFASSIVHDGAGSFFVGGVVMNVQGGNDSQEWFVTRRFTGGGSSYYPGEFNPLWDNWLLWVYGYRDPAQLFRILEEVLPSEPALEGAIWTGRVEDTLRFPDRMILLTPKSELAAVQWLIKNLALLERRRTAPIQIFLTAGGEAARYLETEVARRVLR